MTAEETIAAIRTDLAYAIRQLRVHRDIGRALDALDRIEERLEAQPKRTE